MRNFRANMSSNVFNVYAIGVTATVLCLGEWIVGQTRQDLQIEFPSFDDASSLFQGSNTMIRENLRHLREEEVTQPYREMKLTPPAAQQFIGIVVAEEYDDVVILGTVIKYDVDTEWFRVEYTTGKIEHMKGADVHKHLATNRQIQKAHGIIVDETTADDGSQRTPAPGEGTSTRRARRARRNNSSYVPLAFRETRKDAYYYY